MAANDIKRLNYFTGQFLETQDFQDEQNYHIDMRWRLNRLLYSPGIVDGGFKVTKIGDKRIKVGAGFAIDGNGRELLIITPQEKDISGFAANASVYIALRYAYATLPEDNRTKENISGFIRITERPEIKLLSALPSGNDVGIDIPIAKLQLDGSGNTQSTIDTSVRQLANLMVRGGKVGIGTTGPEAKLEVAVDANDANTKPLVVGKLIRGVSEVTFNYLTILNNGNVGIGNTTPQAKLDIGGGIKTNEIRIRDIRSGRWFDIYFENETIVFCHQSGSGQFMGQDGNWQKKSDISLKENISELHGILDKTMQLIPVKFSWKCNKTNDIGFIAQDVEKVFPELVSTIKDYQGNKGEIKGLPYSHFGVIAIAAIKEMKELFDERLKLLEQRLETLRCTDQ